MDKKRWRRRTKRTGSGRVREVLIYANAKEHLALLTQQLKIKLGTHTQKSKTNFAWSLSGLLFSLSLPLSLSLPPPPLPPLSLSHTHTQWQCDTCTNCWKKHTFDHGVKWLWSYCASLQTKLFSAQICNEHARIKRSIHLLFPWLGIGQGSWTHFSTRPACRPWHQCNNSLDN